MLSRCSNSRMLLLSVFVVVSGFLVGCARAAADDKTKLGNETIERTVQLRTHSLYAPYIDQDLQNRWWDFGADSYVNTNKHIRLTRPKPSQMGWLWSRLPITASNYVIEAEFKVSGESTHLFGDGLAIWLTKERTNPGPIFGNQDKFDGLGIFLDTYANARHAYSFPRVSAFIGDGKTPYDFGTDGDEQSLGGCSANYRRTNVATKVKITYMKEKFLDIKLQYKAWDDWSDCIYLEGVTLPATPFLGFSAMTGDVFDAHDIITVTTYSAILTPPPATPEKKKSSIFGGSAAAASSPDDSPGTWLGFFFKLFLLAGICAGGFFGYKEYQRRQKYAGGGNFGGAVGGGGGGAGLGTGRMGMGGVGAAGYGDSMYSSSRRF